MSKYTSGELAKRCGVSVRTVQYYDTRGILIPSELSEGGRRLYTEEDLRKMKIICFLRETGLPINSIRELFSQENPESVISILLEQQESTLRAELSERQTKLAMLEQIKRSLKSIEHFSVESIADIAYIMNNKQKLRKIHIAITVSGILLDIFQIAALVLSIKMKMWWIFFLAVGIAGAMGICFAYYYYQHVAYICPQCHKVFIPKFKEMFFARHTPATRKLTCTHCSYQGFCVETCKTEKTEN